MKRRADIYFVLYLTAIVSFFVVENQVKEYKRSTNKLINRLVFREKLVSIRSTDIHSDDKAIHTSIELNGDIDRSKSAGDVLIKSKTNTTRWVKIPLQMEGTGYAGALEDAKKYFTEKDTCEVTAELKVKPIITDKVREKWVHELDAATARELEQRLATAGEQDLTEVIDPAFIPIGHHDKMPELPFILSAQSPSLNVLQGLEFTTQVSISGVPSPKDYDIEIVKGGTPYRLNIQKELVRVILSGTATEPGEIVLRAHNHLTGKTSDLSLRVNLRTPRFMTQNSTRGYVGDTYTFDGRLESIAEDLMKVSVSGVTERQCSGAVMENVPLPHAGQLVFSVYINDKKVSSLDYRVTVIEPPAPELKYIAYRNLVATIEIHSYGKVNGQPNTGRISNFISGARNATKIGERVLGSTTVTTYELRLQPPREGNRIHLELKAKDARQRESAVFIQEFQVQ